MDSEVTLIRDFILRTFDWEELEDFCFYNFNEVYLRFTGQMTQKTRIRSLLEYCYRRNQVLKLMIALEEERPELYSALFPRHLRLKYAHPIANKKSPQDELPAPYSSGLDTLQSSLYPVKFVVTGAMNCGKTLFISSISEIDIVSTERKVSSRIEQAIKKTTTVAMDFGRKTFSKRYTLYLFGVPGQRRFDFMWDILSQGMIGFVFSFDSTEPATFRESKLILQTFKRFNPNVPYIVAANKQDHRNAWTIEEIKSILLMSGEKIVPCVATNKESVKNVLYNLLLAILENSRASQSQ